MLVLLGLAALLTASADKAVAAGYDVLLDDLANGKKQTSPPRQTDAKSNPLDWDMAFSKRTNRKASGSDTILPAAGDDRAGTDSADYVAYAAFLLMALGGMTALAASWILRRRSGRFCNGIARSGGAVPRYGSYKQEVS